MRATLFVMSMVQPRRSRALEHSVPVPAGVDGASGAPAQGPDRRGPGIRESSPATGLGPQSPGEPAMAPGRSRKRGRDGAAVVMPTPGDLGRKAAEPQSPAARAQRDWKGRFAPGHPKLGGRRPAQDKAVTLIREAGRQQASQSQGTDAPAAERDGKGRFVPGHPKLGGRRPGSRNQHGLKAAFGELVAAAQTSE